MKKFFGEFRKFITRGNVLDMAVGVIVGGAFTGVVNGLSNFILKPVINHILAFIIGADTLAELYWILNPAYVIDETGKKVLDLTQSIYIDWGSFINAIINFILIAFVLFIIVKTINTIRDKHEDLTEIVNKKKLTKEDKKELKARGIKRSNRKAVKAYLEEKERLAAEADAKAKAETEAKAAAERAANPTTEELLKQIIELMKEQ